VAVIGLGLLGLLTSRLVEANGCLVTGIDTSAERIRFAKKRGSMPAAGSRSVPKTSALTDGHGFDAVLIWRCHQQ
jgi:polar amino acid transport system substrate-binding protein